MTLCSSESKATRSGKPQENDCKIIFAGRGGNMTTWYSAASERRIVVSQKTEMNLVSCKAEVHLGDRRRSLFFETRLGGEVCVGWCLHHWRE